MVARPPKPTSPGSNLSNDFSWTGRLWTLEVWPPSKMAPNLGLISFHLKISLERIFPKVISYISPLFEVKSGSWKLSTHLRNFYSLPLLYISAMSYRTLHFELYGFKITIWLYLKFEQIIALQEAMESFAFPRWKGLKWTFLWTD